LNWDTFFQSTDIKILLYLQDRDGVRYSDLLKGLNRSRGILARSLNDLRKKKLIERTVEQTTPIQTKYRLTEKGTKALRMIQELQKITQ